MLRSRDAELAALDRLLEDARSGHGAALLFHGEPGIGKSALMAAARDHASGMRVLMATCVEAEAALGYAVLQQLLGGVMDQAGSLPVPQSHALRTAFGLEVSETVDRFLVSLAALTLLSAIAEEQPVLCLVDDIHWADRPSLDVITFIARRLQAEPIALLATARDGDEREPRLTGIATMQLNGLSAEDAAAVLQEEWGAELAPAVRRTLVRAAGGNPLALEQLPRVLTVNQRAGRDQLPDPLPLARDLERIFAGTVERLNPDTRTVALLCAAHGQGSLAVIEQAASQLGVKIPLLELPGLDRVVAADGATIGFRHPLVRSAVYHGASQAERRAAHLALAAALAGDESQQDRWAWHRAEAALAPDEDVAAELERSAVRTIRRAGYAAAAHALERASMLSPATGDRVRRTVAAADAALRGGDTPHARNLIRQAEQLGLTDPQARLRAHYLQAAMELRAGIPADGLAILVRDVEEAAAIDPPLALRMLGIAGEAAFQAGDLEAYWRMVPLLAELAEDGDAAQRLHARLQLALIPGGSTERPDIERDTLAAEQVDDPDLLVRIAGLVFAFGAYAAARRLWTKAVSRARALGAAGSLAGALRALALDELSRSRYAWAEASAAEGRSLAFETGQPNLALQHAAILAEVAGLRGHEQEALLLADEVLNEATASGSHGTAALVRRALGQLSLAWGRPEEALKHLEALWTLNASPHQATALAVIPDLIEAAVHAGRPELAREWLRRMPDDPKADFPEARALALRSQALVATGREAEARFEEAVSVHATTDRPLDKARTALLFGEYLRRERRRVDARAPLRTALDTFERLGAVPWAERARTELRATGETARKRDASTFDQLTRQELQVVRVVSQGATNREAAAQLIVSPRTIDHHMRSIFAKLGISSRAELIRLAATGELPDSY